MLYERSISLETYAVIRYGMGFPVRGAPVDAAGLLDRVNGPDRILETAPYLPFSDGLQLGRALRFAQRAKNKGGDKVKLKDARKAMNAALGQALLNDLTRAVETDDPFRERLHSFWTNHFTARAKTRYLRAAHAGYAGEAIRPHLTGYFGDMLKATVTHPFMMFYLDQQESVGPNSPFGTFKKRGLNENLAREALELHSVGPGGGYSQTDVREFAELLTGLSASLKKGFAFLPDRAEPGAEVILGKSYGGGDATLADIHTALDDLAVHPSTAAHISRKLAMHFTADTPDEDLVAHMTAAYAKSQGHLGTVYAAMLEHPAAWRDFGAKVKQPFELVKTSLRAIGVRASDLEAIGVAQVRKLIDRPLKRMGQPYLQPPGPDGWPDRVEDWVHAHGMAARIGWALALTSKRPNLVTNPRHFARAALGDAVNDRLIWAAGVAQTRSEGMALVLASAEFNRR